jgi:2-polyprenyl-3-methyl-5-hydroxy-6-metoxy-1,4-benzoquinol methylase
MSSEYFSDPRPDIQALVTPAGGRFLDVGCGGGALARALKANGAEYVAGVEADADAAEMAREHVDCLVHGSVLEAPLPFAPAEFDYVIFADVLEHLMDPGAAIRRSLPFLAETGRVIVSVPNMRFYLVLLRLILDRWSYTDAGIRDRTHVRIFTRHSLVATLAQAGLEVERLRRNYRLVEDQSHIGRVGAVATRVARVSIAPLLFRNLMAYQYVAIARRADGLR